MKQYTKKEFDREFSSDDACLKVVFTNRYGAKHECPVCHLKGRFHKLADRKRYDCQCGYGVYPLSGTIFHKSDTSLKDWFYAMFLFSSSKNGVAAKEIERQLGVTYKTAWRMAKQIRLLFAQNNIPLAGVVETDETYIGGKGGHNKRGRGAENKTAVFGMVERKGRVKAQVIPNARMKTLQPIINSSISKKSLVITDEFLSYNKVANNGYKHERVKHAVKEYVRGKIHTNNIEGFWSQLKRSIDGTHHVVSPKYLQSYVDEFVYRYNHRKGEQIFPLVLAEAVKRV